MANLKSYIEFDTWTSKPLYVEYLTNTGSKPRGIPLDSEWVKLLNYLEELKSLVDDGIPEPLHPKYYYAEDLTFEEYWQQAGDGDNFKIDIYKYGHIVVMEGCVKHTKDTAFGSSATMFTLPTELCPPSTIIQPGAIQNNIDGAPAAYNLCIYKNGNVKMEKARNHTGSIAIPNTAVISIAGTYFTEEA